MLAYVCIQKITSTTTIHTFAAIDEASIVATAGDNRIGDNPKKMHVNSGVHDPSGNSGRSSVNGGRGGLFAPPGVHPIFLGDPSQRKNPISNVILCPPFPTGVALFLNNEQSMMYGTDLSGIRAGADGAACGLNEVERNRRWKLWHANIQAFIMKWGVMRVPPDVRHAVTSVEQALGLPRTNWPAFEFM